MSGCRVEPLEFDELPVSTYLRTEADGDFFMLTRDIDLLTLEALADEEQHSPADLSLCEPAA